jgi:hypothetical protein
MALMAELGCTRGAFDRQVARIQSAPDLAEKRALATKALDARLRLARLWESLLALQVSITDTPGELGTLANLEQHNRQHEAFLSRHDTVLTEALGDPLPPEAEPSRHYTGPARLTVLTVRSQAEPGEALELPVVVLDPQEKPFERLALCWRPLGSGPFEERPLTAIAGAIYRATLPPSDADLEYYLEARTADGRTLVWPPTTPLINQTVVRLLTADPPSLTTENTEQNGRK